MKAGKTLLAAAVVFAAGAGVVVLDREGAILHIALEVGQRLGITGITSTASEGVVRPAGVETPAARAGGGARGTPPVAVVAAEAKLGDFPIIRTTVGLIEPVASVIIRARIDGQIVEQRVADGQQVKAGDILFRLDDREIRAQTLRDQAQIDRDEATLARAEVDLQRFQDLSARNVTSQMRTDQMATDVKVAAANVAAGQAALQTSRVRLSYTEIRAPIDGQLGTIRVTPGNLVKGSETTGDGLVTVTAIRPLRVSFTLPERDLPLLRASLGSGDGQGSGRVRVYVGESQTVVAEGAVSFIETSVDVQSGTVTAKAVLPNEDRVLWPGQFVRVAVELGRRSDVVIVPLVAIQAGQTGPYVFAIKDGAADVRAVELAGTIADTAAISTGLSPGERVVIDGQLRLRRGSRVVETPAGEKRGGGNAGTSLAPRASNTLQRSVVAGGG